MEKGIWNPERECMRRADLERLQLERLRSLVDYCDRNVAFYHQRLSAAGVTAERIKTLSDIQYIPYTTKEDLRDNYPFGLLSVPMKDIVRVHASSGGGLYPGRSGRLVRAGGPAGRGRRGG